MPQNKEVLVSHALSLRDREVVLGPPGDQVRMIPECPCMWCEAVRDNIRQAMKEANQ